jgi:hypothetical protein
MNKLPIAINRNIVVQHVGKELLIYNLITNKAFCLNETSRIVFESCDGVTSFEDLKRKYKFTDDLIYFALDELNKENLLEGGAYKSPLAGLSRRQVIRRTGLAAMAVLPVVAGLIAPTAANAQSGCVGQVGISPGGAAVCSVLSSPINCPQVAGSVCCSGTGSIVITSPSTYPLCIIFPDPTVQVCVCD